VFGWGLQYKMSLYGLANGFSTSVPQAKLLSQKERPASHREKASIRPASTHSQAPMFFTLLLIAALAASLPCSAAMRMQTASLRDVSSQQRRAHVNYFSFRPPPASIPSY
jgi:hypothetical protein